MPKPAFAETMQVVIVVRELDAAIRRGEDDFGIGPWVVYRFQPGGGIQVVHLGTRRALGVILEVFDGLPGKQKPDAT